MLGISEFMGLIQDFCYVFFTNKVVLSLIFAFIVAEIVKLITSGFKQKCFSPSCLVKGGGMPSTHTSLVSALTFSVLFNHGFSVMWVAIAIFSIIIARDAFGVRKHAGEHAKLLNIMLKDSKLRKKYESKYGGKKLQESIGHKPIEVFMGVVVGLIIAFIVWFIHMKAQYQIP